MPEPKSIYTVAYDELNEWLTKEAKREGRGDYVIRQYRGEIQDRDATLELEGAVRANPHILLRMFPGDVSQIASEPGVVQVEMTIGILICAGNMRSEENADRDALSALEFVLRALGATDIIVDAAEHRSQYTFLMGTPQFTVSTPELTVYEIPVVVDHFIVNLLAT